MYLIFHPPTVNQNIFFTGPSDLQIICSVRRYKWQVSVCASLVSHSRPTLSPWCNWFLALDQQRDGACLAPALRAGSWCLGCENAKNWCQVGLWLQTSFGARGAVQEALMHWRTLHWQQTVSFTQRPPCWNFWFTPWNFCPYVQILIGYLK